LAKIVTWAIKSTDIKACRMADMIGVSTYLQYRNQAAAITRRTKVLV
jgi:hypothetical protein